MVRKVVAEFDAINGPFISKLSAIDASVARFERGTLNAFGKVEKGMSQLVSSAAMLRGVGGALAGGFAANFGTQFLDQATRIRNSLRAAGDDSDEMFKKVYLASTRSLSSFTDFSQGVMRMHKVLGERQSMDATIRQMETLNKLLATGGASTQERISTMIQFGQALQSGVLQGEELRSLRENAPIELIRAIATEAGGTVEQLKELGAEGQLTTDVMVRALVRLEKEADAKMGQVVLTIQDAAQVMRNGAIVAAEGFDAGLGLSRAAVAGLTGLGEILGENAEAFEAVGKAVQVFGMAFAAVYAGGKISAAASVIGGLGERQRQYTAALKASASAAEREYAMATRGVAKAQERFKTTSALIDKLAMQAGSEKKLASANEQHSKAVAGLAAAQQRQAIAANAASVATMRLSMASRVAAGSLAMLKSAVAFLGGIPGILFLIGTAAFTMSSSVESAAARMDRLTSDTGSASSAADSLRDVQTRLRDAIAATGTAATDASGKIIAGTEAEYKAKKDLLALETQRLQMTQTERTNEIGAVQGQIGGLYDHVESARANMQLSGVVDEEALAQMTAEADAKAEGLRGKIIELRAAYEESARVIAENNALLGQSFDGVAASIEGAAVAGVTLSDDALASYNERLATLTAEANMQALIRQYGEDSYQVAVARAAAEREAYAATIASEGITGELADRLMEAYDAANMLSSTDVGGMIRAALGPAASLAATLWDAASAAAATRMAQIDAGAAVRRIPGGVDAIASGDVRVSDKGWRRYVAPKIAGAGSSGAGSGGGSGGGAGKSPEEEALRFIEQMMTAEEKRAKQLKEMADLRQKLVEKVGEEHSTVTRLDEAISRARDGMDGLNNSAKKLKDDFLDAIVAGEGFGGMLNSLAQSARRAFAEMVLFNTGPWANPRRRSGGLLGGLFGGLGNLLGFADGGVMTGQGSVPLKRYSKGGIANRAQLAMFGEGSTPEAYVPLPDGRSIPVSLNMPDFAKMGGAARDMGAVRYVEVPYIARVDADDNGRLAARIEGVRRESAANTVAMARTQKASLPGTIQSIQDRGTS